MRPFRCCQLPDPGRQLNVGLLRTGQIGAVQRGNREQIFIDPQEGSDLLQRAIEICQAWRDRRLYLVVSNVI